MKATNTLAAGGRVLQALQGSGEYVSKELWLFCEERTLGVRGFMRSHDHFMQDGYILRVSDDCYHDSVCLSFMN